MKQMAKRNRSKVSRYEREMGAQFRRGVLTGVILGLGLGVMLMSSLNAYCGSHLGVVSP